MAKWTLSTGLDLPDPDVRIYLSETLIESGRSLAPGFRRERPPADIADAALNTYRWAWDNAVRLLDEALLLAANERHARAFVLACMALEEIGKSQYAADVHTGFVSHDRFHQNLRDHRYKSAYASRDVEFGLLIQPLVRDEAFANELFLRRNDALYASPSNEVIDASFEQDAATMIDYCRAWLEIIAGQEEIAERIGTKAFLK